MRTRTASMRRAPAGLAAWVGLLLVAVVLLTAWSDPRVATPALGNLSAWGDWAAGNDPVLVAVALLRLVLIGLTWYLLGATAIQVAARLSHNARMARFADALSIPIVRQVVSTGLGVSLAATMVTAATGGAQPADPHAPTVAAATDPGDSAVMPPGSLPRTAAAQQTADVQHAVNAPVEPRRGMDRRPLAPVATAATAAGMQRVAPADGDGARAMERTPLSSRGTDEPGDAGRTMPTTWTVRSGDHLWRIAETVLAKAHGSPQDDDTIAPYWLALVEANRSRLPDPDNPDLLYAGIQLHVPPVPDSDTPAAGP